MAKSKVKASAWSHMVILGLMVLILIKLVLLVIVISKTSAEDEFAEPEEMTAQQDESAEDFTEAGEVEVPNDEFAEDFAEAGEATVPQEEFEDVVNENGNREDYYTSLIGVQNLVRKEQEIVRKLDQYRQKLQDRIELIQFFLDDYLEDAKSMKRYFANGKTGNEKYPTISTDHEQDLTSFSEEVSANPLRVFKLIRRFQRELQDVIDDLETEDMDADIKWYFNELGGNFNLPSGSDLMGAADGLLRLQLVYQLPTFQMAKGTLVDTKTKCALNAFDMQFIGIRAFDDNLYATAIEWLYSSYQRVLKGDDTVQLYNIQNDLLAATAKHNHELLMFQPALHRDLFTNLVNSNYSNVPELYIPPAISDYQYGQAVDSIYDLYNFNGLCRAEKLLSPVETKNFRCWYSTSHSLYNLLSPLKFEMLHEAPPVYQVYDLISDATINHLKNKAFPNLKRAKIVGSKETGGKSDTRTSAVAWIMDHFDNPLTDEVVSKIPRIIKQVTGLEGGKHSAAEELQVSCYGGVGGFYTPHFDAFRDPRIPPEDSFENSPDAWRGDRVTTVMFYLSNVELGGGTAFPRLGIAATPVKGSAVMWHNLLKNGERDLLTLHGGCPVLYGNKWGMLVANKWIRINGQFHYRKCSLNETE